MRTLAFRWFRRLFPVAGALWLGGLLQAEPAPIVRLFEEVTAPAGLEGVAATRARVGDIDRDGYPDAILEHGVFFNRPGEGGGRRYVRAASDAFLAPAGGRPDDIVQMGDVDNDGDLDLFLGRITDLRKPDFVDDGLRNEIWLSDGVGGFVHKEGSGVEAPPECPLSACFVDADRDGCLDLFVGNAFLQWGRTNEAGPDRLFRGRGDGTFADVSEAAGLLVLSPQPDRPDSRTPTFGVTHTDWDNDGDQDLLVMTYGRGPNRLWRANADGTYIDMGAETTFDGDADRSGTYLDVVKQSWARQGVRMEDEPPFRSHGNTFDCAVGDYDGDGDMDCFLGEIAHGWAGPSSDPSMLLVNQGASGGWRFARDPVRIPRRAMTLNENWGDQHVAWCDVDNDGLLDLLIASSDYPDEQFLKLFHQEAEGRFSDWTHRLGFRWLNGIQMGLGDYDRDGAIDILLSRWHMRLTPEQQAAWPVRAGLFRNLAPAAAGNRFLSIRLEGAGKGGANREGVGARVTVRIGEAIQTREVCGGHGCGASHDDNACHFGVGKAERVDRVEVRWPDRVGTVQVFEGVATNRFYVLRQGAELRPLPR